MKQTVIRLVNQRLIHNMCVYHIFFHIDRFLVFIVVINICEDNHSAFEYSHKYTRVEVILLVFRHKILIRLSR